MRARFSTKFGMVRPYRRRSIRSSTLIPLIWSLKYSRLDETTLQIDQPFKGFAAREIG
jgi:hypothetical protein